MSLIRTIQDEETGKIFRAADHKVGEQVTVTKKDTDTDATFRDTYVADTGKTSKGNFWRYISYIKSHPE